MQPIQQAPSATATTEPTIAPDVPAPSGSDASPAENAVSLELSGRLLYRKGLTLEILDLATGDTRTIGEGVTVNSAFDMNQDLTRGVFIDFPNFGVFDIASGEVTPVPNTGSNPNSLSISPDGRWLVATTGSIVTRLQVTDLDTLTTQNVASGSSAFYQLAFTPTSNLIWWEATDPTPQRYDPATNTSTPVTEPFPVADIPGAAISPDGTRFATISIAPGVRFDGSPAGGDAATCIESEIQLAPSPIFPASTELAAQIETIYADAGLVASSPVWLDDDTLLFVRLGYGECGQVEGEQERAVMRLDLDGSAPQVIVPRLGNETDPSDFAQSAGRSYSHLFSVSPDSQLIAWIDAERDTRETMINVTDIATGHTQTVLYFSEDDAASLADFLEEITLRQVVWLP